jgi:hypothetical protein
MLLQLGVVQSAFVPVYVRYSRVFAVALLPFLNCFLKRVIYTTGASPKLHRLLDGSDYLLTVIPLRPFH